MRSAVENKLELGGPCLLLENKVVAEGWHRLILRSAALARALPGQFVQLRPGPGTDPLLRRPFSVHLADPSAGQIWLLIRISGPGTARLASAAPGEMLDAIGPFGRGFPCLDEPGKALLVGGGIGLAPLYYFAALRRRQGLPFEFLAGGAGAASLPGGDYFLEQGLTPLVATEDGSRGVAGTVVDLLAQRLDGGEKPARIHACGPPAMLAAVVELGRARGVPTHVSLEARLACGVGACLGCALPFRRGGGIEYRRVCRDGPVFDGEEVCFDG